MNNNKENKNGRIEQPESRRKCHHDEHDMHNQLLKLTLINTEMKQKFESLSKKYSTLQNQNINLKDLLSKPHKIHQQNQSSTKKNLQQQLKKISIENQNIHRSLKESLHKNRQFEQVIKKEKNRIQCLETEIKNLNKSALENQSKLIEIQKQKNNMEHIILELQQEVKYLQQKPESIIQERIIELQEQNKDKQLQLINKQDTRIQQHRLIHDKQLKVAIADYQFQVRRLTQDHATYVTLNQMQKVRVCKEYQTKINNLKHQLEEQNQNWINRFDIRDKQFKNDVQTIKIRLQQEYKKISESQRMESKKLIKQLQMEKDAIVKNLKKEMQDQKHKIIMQHNKEISEIKISYQTKIREITDKYQQLIKRMQKDHQIKVVCINSEKKTEEHLHISTKTELIKLKEVYKREVAELKRDKETLEQNLHKINNQKRQLKQQIANIKITLNQKQTHYQSQILSLQQTYQQKEQVLKESVKNKIIQILQGQLLKTEQFDSNIKFLEENQLKQEQHFNQQIQYIKNCFEERPSRKQDIQMIRQLEQKLFLKQIEIENIYQQLKINRLELQNKEQTYNKIFSQGYSASDVNKVMIEKQMNRIPLLKQFKFRKIGRSLVVGRDASKKATTPSAKLL